MIRNTVKSLANVAFAPLRKRVSEGRISRLKNTKPTIIANNCIAGVVYHDLNLPFLSPTINMWIDEKEYFEFIEHFEEYLNCVPEKSELVRSYPVIKICREDTTVHLHCVHYGSAEEAIEKWIARAKRVDLENVYVFFEFPYPVNSESEVVKQFQRVKYKNKVMFAKCKTSDIKDADIVHLRSYDYHMYPGKTVHYSSYITHKRHLDLFDYVSFLNRGQ